MRTAFLFPGQASQFVGMGQDLYERFPVAKVFFDRADDQLPFDLKRLCFDGPNEELTQTRVTQPAIFVVSVIAAQLLDSQVEMRACAGHSLGEYSALVAAGAINFDDGLALVALRGELMQNAGDERPGTMAAVIGMDEAQVTALCEAASEGDEVVVPANFNSPGQVVVSGDVAAVDRAVAQAKPMGAKLAKKLNVSGAFHSPLMAPAAEQLAEKLEQTMIRPPSVPIYLNVTGKLSRQPEDIRSRLIDQLTHPVLWEQSIRAMAEKEEIDSFLEVGPGNVLQGLVKRTVKGATLAGAGTADEIDVHCGREVS